MRFAWSWLSGASEAGFSGLSLGLLGFRFRLANCLPFPGIRPRPAQRAESIWNAVKNFRKGTLGLSLPSGSLDAASARRAIMVAKSMIAVYNQEQRKCAFAAPATLFGGLRDPLPGGRGQQVRFGRKERKHE